MRGAEPVSLPFPHLLFHRRSFFFEHWATITFLVLLALFALCFLYFRWRRWYRAERRRKREALKASTERDGDDAKTAALKARENAGGLHTPKPSSAVLIGTDSKEVKPTLPTLTRTAWKRLYAFHRGGGNEA